MEPIHLNNDGNSIKEPSFQELVLTSSPEISGILGDPQVYPRVGDGYQAEITPLISETELYQLLLNPCDSEGILDGFHFFLNGLPIPVTWVHSKMNDKEDEGCRRNHPDNSANENRSSKSRMSRKNNSLKKGGSKQKSEPQDLGMDDGPESKPSNLGMEVAMKTKLPWLHKIKNYDLVPGSLDHPWTDAEVNRFILGLYIFGKNFVQIKRFLGKKEMGDILSFYYGEFYRSDGYRRWSDCQRTKRKKCIYGHKLFTGWRLQELLSRLLPHVPEHSHNAFIEVSTAFSEGKFSLEDYVSNLKAIVGIQALVDAIGIGKGKTDLTSVAMEPSKSNPLFTVCPIGKACSSLTCSDIIKLLTGGIRLSKARCNDIFWEAVWPRLLARGWHSEQPKNHSYMGPNHYLVFLIPGVKKFSRRKLVKGNHYFDSVSDVLSKVASEPKLIELENEEHGGSSFNERDQCAAEVPSSQDNPSIQQTHRYLKPRVSNKKLVRFTVVDSGLVDGGKLSKMREMRYVPQDLKVKSLFTTLSSSIQMVFSDNQTDDSDQVSVMSLDGGRNVNNVDCCDKALEDCASNHTKFTVVDTSLISAGNSLRVRELRYSPVLGIDVTSEMNNSSRKKERDYFEDPLDVHVPNATNKLLNGESEVYKSNHSKDTIDSYGSEQKTLDRDTRNKSVESLQDNNVSSKNQSTGTIKHKFSRRSKSGQSNNLVPVSKRRRLTACSNSEICHVFKSLSVDLESKLEGSCCALSSAEGGSNTFQGNSPQKLSLSSSLAGGCLEESNRSMSEATCFGIETSDRENVKHETSSLIDLNLPQVLLDSENDERALMDVESNQAASTDNACFLFNSEKPAHEALRASTDANPAAEQANMYPRRQSTRNRPLTTRALEALECGFMGVKRQKGMQVHAHELPVSSHSCSVHSKGKGTSSRGDVSSDIVDAKEGDAKGAFDKRDFVDKTPERIEESC